MLSTVPVSTNRRAGKKQAMYVTVNKEQRPLALSSSLDCVLSANCFSLKTVQERKGSLRSRKEIKNKLKAYAIELLLVSFCYVILTRFVVMKSFHGNNVDVQQHSSNPDYKCYFCSIRY